MKILLTGGSGFVGMRIWNRYKGEHDFSIPRHSEMDITKEESCMQYMEKEKPELVLHFAAISNMAICEKNPQDSYQVNFLGAVHVAKACKHVGAKMIFASSDQVYNGNLTEDLGRETDMLTPVNIYANHKLEAEKQVIEIAQAVCLRLPWMCDAMCEEYPVHADFFSNLSQGIRQGISMKFSPDDRRSITNVNDIVENIMKMAEAPGGAYNFAATGYYSVYDIAYAVVRAMELKERKLLLSNVEKGEKSSNGFGRNIAMDMSKVTQVGVEFDDVILSIEKLI